MKGIATINFKGGVGKTTITWLLAKYIAEKQNKKVLIVDTDAQMSLTLAVQLQDDGALYKDFDKWYKKHKGMKRTILDAIYAYDKMEGGYFDFPIDFNFIFKMNKYLYFLPSIMELYWLEIESFDREKIKHFIRALMGKMENSKYFNFDYIFFDCPPNFTALSYSVLSCSSMILIPVNPDIFASHGVKIMIDGLMHRVQPWPNPKVAVFMNKAKLYKDDLTTESKRYWEETEKVCDMINHYKDKKIIINTWDTYIPERVDIKRAINPQTPLPLEYDKYFNKLWENIQRTVR